MVASGNIRRRNWAMCATSPWLISLGTLCRKLAYICIEHTLSLHMQQGYSSPSEKNTGEKKKNTSNGKKRHKRQMRKWKDRTPSEASNWHGWRSFSITMEGKWQRREEKMTVILTKKGLKKGRKNIPTLCIEIKVENKKRQKWFNMPKIVDRECKLWRIGGWNVCRGFCWIA